VFDGVDRYTRRGDFQLDKSGFLVNGAGYYLEGIPIDPTTGNPSGSSPQVLKFQNDFLPAQENHQDRLPRQPCILSADHQTRYLRAGIGIDPADVVQFPVTIPWSWERPRPFIDTSTSGTAQNNKAAAANTGATKLSGLAGSDSIGTNFAAGDTITVNGTVVTFVASGATGNQLNITDDISTLLAKIDSITGKRRSRPRSRAGGDHACTPALPADLSVSSSNSTAFAALGFCRHRGCGARRRPLSAPVR